MSRMPATCLLEVRLQEIGGVAGRRVPILEGLEQFGEPLTGVVPPGAEQGAAGRRHQIAVAADQPEIQQPDAGTQLPPGDLGALGGVRTA